MFMYYLHEAYQINMKMLLLDDIIKHVALKCFEVKMILNSPVNNSVRLMIYK